MAQGCGWKSGLDVMLASGIVLDVCRHQAKRAACLETGIQYLRVAPTIRDWVRVLSATRRYLAQPHYALQTMEPACLYCARLFPCTYLQLRGPTIHSRAYARIVLLQFVASRILDPVCDDAYVVICTFDRDV